MTDLIGLAFRAFANRDKIQRAIDLTLPILEAYRKVSPELVPLINDLIDVFAPPIKPQTYDVAWIQRTLNHNMNAGLTVDGIYGTGTKEAVRKFQHKYGLVEDGWVGPMSAAKLQEIG